LVVPTADPSSEPRLRMLETVRTYAEEKFAELPDRSDVEARHTAWMFELLIGPSRTIEPPHHQSWLERFDLDRANLRGAVERALRDHDAATVVNLVRACIGYLSLRDAEAEAQKWLDAASRDVSATTPLVHAQLLVARSVLLGSLGRYDEARVLMDEALALDVRSDDPFDIALAAMAEAVLASAQSQSRDALDAVLRGADAMGAINSDVGQAYMWQTAGTIALTCDPARADEYLNKGLALAETMDNDGLRAQSHSLLGFSARGARREDEARSHFVLAAEAALRSGQRSSMAYALDGLAAAAVDAGLPMVAAQSIACSRCARSYVDRTTWASFDPLIDEVHRAARTALGDDEFSALTAEGSCADAPGMVQLALDAVAGTT